MFLKENVIISERLKSFFKERTKVNFAYNLLTQIVNYAFPLITFPYLVRVLGLDGFGLYSFSVAFVAYFQLIVDYGFGITGTRETAINRNNPEMLSKLFNNIFFIKLILFVSCLIVFILILISFSHFELDKYLYLLSFSTIISSILMPTWFFQGMEQIKFVTILNTIAKLISTILILLLVKSVDNILLIPLLYSVTGIIAGIFSLIIIKKRFNISLKFREIKKREVVYNLKESWYLFISNISTSLYTTTLTFLLGIFGTKTEVSYFVIPNKLIMIIRSISEPINQTLFPYLSSNLQNTKVVKCVIRKILNYGVPALLAVILMLTVFSDYIFNIIFKVDNIQTIINFNIQSLLPLIFLFHTVFGFFYLILFKMNKEYSKIIITTSLLSIPLSFVLIYFYKDIGASISLLLIELYIGYRYFNVYQKTKTNIFNNV